LIYLFIDIDIYHAYTLFPNLDNLGCFDSELGPLSHVGTHPWPPEEIDTKFILFTPTSQFQGELIDWLDPVLLTSSSFDPQLKTVIFSHGFGSAGNLTFIRKTKDAFFAVVSV
jgi:hypothetical protein